MKPDIEKRLRRIGNSLGLWVVLFSGFGLLSLSLGEEKIRKRMMRNQIRMNRYVEPTADRAGETRAIKPPEQAAKASSGSQTSGNSSPTPYKYRLTALRWILGFAVFAGSVSLVYTSCRSQPDP